MKITYLAQSLATFVAAVLISHTSQADSIQYSQPKQYSIISESTFPIRSSQRKKALLVEAFPPESPRQKVISHKTFPETTQATDSTPLSRPLLVGSLFNPEQKPGSETLTSVEYVVELKQRTLLENTSSSSDLSTDAGDSSLFLDSTKTIDWKEPMFQRWLKTNHLFKEATESPLQFAKRTYQFLLQRGKYMPPSADWKASLMCKDLKTDCGGFALVFTAICRANGIPARMLVGRWAISAENGKQLGRLGYGQWHVYPEFFLEKIGWIPADVTSAIVHDKTEKKLNFFGNEPWPFLTMHYDTDLAFNDGKFPAKEMLMGQMPTVWVNRNSPQTTQITGHRWKVTEVPTNK